MPTNTYVALDKKTVTSAVASVEFTSIPGTYTDLVIVANIKGTSASNYLNLRFNSDTGSNYSRTTMSANGSSATSERRSNQTQINTDYNEVIEANFNYVNTLHIMNYSNTTTNKTVLCRANNAATGTGTTIGLWRNTAAITSIQLVANNNTFDVGSNFSLYGIKAWAAETTPKATGGYVYEDSTYYYHSFPFSGTFTPNQSLSCDILQIAGGGSGGNGYYSGGGGAGGLVYLNSQSLTATGYTVTVGAGGVSTGTGGNGTSGNNSQFASLTAAIGGGYGAGGAAGGPVAGGSGGSGGGGAADGNGGGAGAGGAGSQGFNGGNSISPGGPNSAGGGGGGFGSAGLNATSNSGGNGGNGVNTYSSWASVTNTGASGYYAGGGGGGGGAAAGATGGTGGLGGAGNGSGYNNSPAVTPGLVSTGSGGGGRTGGGGSGGNGGSGIVIVRYAK